MALYEIKSRFDKSVLFRFDCDTLKLCVEAAVRANISLGDTDLDGADLRDAHLRGADLGGADIRDAHLRGVYLGGAHLGGANAPGIIQLGFPNGWPAWAIAEKDTNRLLITVGCHRDEPLSQGRAYWAGRNNRREVLAALDYAEAIAKLRGWVVT